MMLKLVNLDEHTRRFMLEELNLDLQNGSLYLSSRLTAAGMRNYPRILQEAIRVYDDFWLESELRAQEYIKSTEIRHNGRGSSIVTVPASAPQILAEEEFNRYYIRGVCRVALASSIPKVQVYRAKMVMQPVEQSEALVNQRLDPQQLLEDLRSHPGLGTILGAAPDHGAGLSVCLPSASSV
jgi:hypothetical protein